MGMGWMGMRDEYAYRQNTTYSRISTQYRTIEIDRLYTQ